VQQRRFADLLSVKKLVETGKFKAIIDRCYPMEQAAERNIVL